MKTLIAIPCHEKVDTEFMNSLVFLRKDDCAIKETVSSLIYDARNQLLQEAINLGAEYIMWLDSDIVFEPDLLERLLESLGADDFVSGLYFRRKPPYSPCIFKDCHYEEYEGGLIPIANDYLDYPKNSRFEIDACGFGCVLMRTSMAKDVLEQKGLPFVPVPGFGEDMSFCIRAKECGYKLWCDSSIKVGHISRQVVDEAYYEAYKETVNAE